MSAKTVESARLYQRLEHPLVAYAEIDSLGEIEDRLDRSFFLRRDYRIDCRLADVANSAKTESDSLLADDGELVA